MISCNSCENEKCGSCVAEILAARGTIRSAAYHCGCAERGHKNEDTVPERPNVKGIFSKNKKEEEEIVEKRIITEEEIERD